LAACNRPVTIGSPFLASPDPFGLVVERTAWLLQAGRKTPQAEW